MFHIFMSEIIKLKRSYIGYIHIATMIIYPVLLSVLLGLNRYIKTKQTIMVDFFIIISIASPVMISILAAMFNDREVKAGEYKNELSTPYHPVNVIQIQILFYIILYFCEITLSFVIYWIILRLFFNVMFLPFYYCILFCIFFSSLSIIQYFMSFIIAKMFNTTGVLIFGFMGFILSALSETVIFDKSWIILPWAWQIRTIGLFKVNIVSNKNQFVEYISLYISAVIITIVVFVIVRKLFKMSFK